MYLGLFLTFWAAFVLPIVERAHFPWADVSPGEEEEQSPGPEELLQQSRPKCAPS